LAIRKTINTSPPHRSPYILNTFNGKNKLPIHSPSSIRGTYRAIHIEKFQQYKYLGGTLDDAVGEAYDKVARLLQLGYPGGPIIDKLAQKGKPTIKLPRPLIKDKQKNKYNFSFSGLKTAVLKEIKENKHSKEDIAASFQEAVIDVLTTKTMLAVEEFNIKDIVIAGGVSANTGLRERFKQLEKQKGIKAHFPPLYLCTDNGGMVAFTGYIQDTKDTKKQG